MKERESVRLKKEASLHKPWSDDPIFQTTYFTNVDREKDKVTKWIRENYNFNQFEKDFVGFFEFNMVFARLLNNINSLARMGHIVTADLPETEELLQNWQDNGLTVWGNAYIVSTNGRAMPKAAYVCRNLLPAAWEGITAGLGALRGPSLARAHAALMACNGLGSFLSAQVIADLKHTSGHPLWYAEDWHTWAAPGPGSLRGLGWLGYTKIGYHEFDVVLRRIRGDLKCLLPDEILNQIDDLQNLQNCLCEFDKYCRIKNGTGRSKRKYPGVRD